MEGRVQGRKESLVTNEKVSLSYNLQIQGKRGSKEYSNTM
jgi:hypothetical protein